MNFLYLAGACWWIVLAAKHDEPLYLIGAGMFFAAFILETFRKC